VPNRRAAKSYMHIIIKDKAERRPMVGLGVLRMYGNPTQIGGSNTYLNQYLELHLILSFNQPCFYI
jgi:hypothetical protein